MIVSGLPPDSLPIIDIIDIIEIDLARHALVLRFQPLLVLCPLFCIASRLLLILHHSLFIDRCSPLVCCSSLAAHSSVLFSPRASSGLVPAFELRSILSRTNTAFDANQ